MRGFEVAKGYQNINLPKRSTLRSAGYDIAICESLTLEPKALAKAPTGVKAYMQDNEVLMLYPRSSLAMKGLTIPNNVGIIDADYYGNASNDGAIFVQLYNFSDQPITLEKGERIAQGIFQTYLKASDERPPSQVRAGGFGSTGR